jgi:hypothetical protein
MTIEKLKLSDIFVSYLFKKIYIYICVSLSRVTFYLKNNKFYIEKAPVPLARTTLEKNFLSNI